MSTDEAPTSVLDSRGASPLPVEPPLDGEGRAGPPLAPGRPRTRRRWLGGALMAGGVLLAAYGAWSIWGTGLVEARAQRDLLRAFHEEVLVAAAPGAPAPVSLPATPEGEAVAVMKIPRLGLEKAVVEGTSAGALRKGPGHYPATPLPGQAGNAAIAGHRTTYGAPFSRIDELRPGDAILVATRAGTFRYEVTGSRVIRPSQRSVLVNTPDNRLTLTTCHPKFRATERLVVTAALIGEPIPLRTDPDLGGA